MGFKKTPAGWLITSTEFIPSDVCGACEHKDKVIGTAPCARCDDKAIEPEVTQSKFSMPGWVCPRCGAGNSPFSQRCWCVGFKVTS